MPGTDAAGDVAAMGDTGDLRKREVDGVQVPLIKSDEGKEVAHPSFVEDINMRFRTPSLLLFGATSCIFGFGFITVIGLIEFLTKKENDTLKVPYPSKNGYFPSTVSEMVHDQSSPGGRVFHTFGMMAGLCVFLSWYPFQLKNVYTGSDQICGVYWMTIRQLVPAMGLWMLVGINTYPTPVAAHSVGHEKMANVLLHLTGAGMMFLGYLICELHCLGIVGRSQSPAAPWKKMGSSQKRIRKALSYIILFFFMGFCAFQVTMVAIKGDAVQGKPWCCADVWKFKGDEVPDSENKNLTIQTDAEVVDTATGRFLVLKILSFICEDVAGLALVMNHLVVWWYCDERHIHYGDLQLQDIEIVHKAA